MVILGLGNIGRRYELSRHNLGFVVIRSIMEREKLSLEPPEGEYDWAVKKTESQETVFAMPRTFMNRSGIAADVLLQRLNLDPSQMLVVVDDFNLPLGRIRIRKSGSDGGHNGLASIIETLETDNFPRLRLGIGPVPDNVSSVDFVLDDFEQEEKEPTRKMITAAVEAVMFLLEQGLDQAMTEYNIDPA